MYFSANALNDVNVTVECDPGNWILLMTTIFMLVQAALHQK